MDKRVCLSIRVEQLRGGIKVDRCFLLLLGNCLSIIIIITFPEANHCGLSQPAVFVPLLQSIGFSFFSFLLLVIFTRTVYRHDC